MDHPEYTDVVVIGLGPGGEYAAGTLAEAGLHLTGVESRLVGGECRYYGCVPSKMMIPAANLIAETRRVPGMAGTSTVTPDWSPVAQRIREDATDHRNDKVAAERFTGKGGHLVRGHGKIGLTEEQAEAAGLRVRTGVTQVPYSARGWIHKAGNDGCIKVIEDAERSVLVGASSAGPYGGKVLSALQVAVRAEVPLASLRNMPYAYPTFYRAIEEALKKPDQATGGGSS